jgi:hypothetical protein
MVRARVGPHARADEAPLLEASFGAVRIQPRDDVEDTSVECTRDEVVLAVADEQTVDEMERGRATGPLHRMDVGLDQEPGLVEVRARLGIRHGDEPDVTPFVRLADRLQRAEVRRLLRPRAQRVGQLFVGVKWS